METVVMTLTSLVALSVGLFLVAPTVIIAVQDHGFKPIPLAGALLVALSLFAPMAHGRGNTTVNVYVAPTVPPSGPVTVILGNGPLLPNLPPYNAPVAERPPLTESARRAGVMTDEQFTEAFLRASPNRAGYISCGFPPHPCTRSTP